MQVEKKVKVSLVADYILLYTENPKDSTQKINK